MMIITRIMKYAFCELVSLFLPDTTLAKSTKLLWDQVHFFFINDVIYSSYKALNTWYDFWPCQQPTSCGMALKHIEFLSIHAQIKLFFFSSWSCGFLTLRVSSDPRDFLLGSAQVRAVPRPAWELSDSVIGLPFCCNSWFMFNLIQ